MPDVQEGWTVMDAHVQAYYAWLLWQHFDYAP